MLLLAPVLAALAAPTAFGADAGLLLDQIYRLSAGTGRGGDPRQQADQYRKLLLEYQVVDGRSKHAHTIVQGLMRRRGGESVSFLLKQLALIASSSLSLQVRGAGPEVPDDLIRFIAVLVAAAARWPSHEPIWRMLALGVCFGVEHWGGTCASSLRRWHSVAGRPPWADLFRRVAREEGVGAPQLRSFLFERLWMDAGEFELFGELSGLHTHPKSWARGVQTGAVRDAERTVAADWDWYSRQPGLLKEAVGSVHAGDLEAPAAWAELGAQIVRGVAPLAASSELLEHVRSRGNTTASGLEYRSGPPGRPESEVHESLFRVSWPLDPGDPVVRAMLRALLASPKWPPHFQADSHVLELGFYSIHGGAAAQGFHRDSYKLPPGDRPATAANFQVALGDVADCAPLELVPRSHLLKDSQLCRGCPKGARARRLRAALPRCSTRASPLDAGDMLAYDPRVFHRGSACDPGDTHAPRVVFWFTLAIDPTPAGAIERAEHLPPNPYLRALWRAGHLVRRRALLDEAGGVEAHAAEL